MKKHKRNGNVYYCCWLDESVTKRKKSLFKNLPYLGNLVFQMKKESLWVNL